jgi:hypothetical protein
MARVNIPVNRVDRTFFTTNAAEVTGDAANDMVVINDGYTFLEVRNTNAADRTFDVHVNGNIDDIPLAEIRTYTVNGTGVGTATGKTGIFPREIYGDTLLVDVADADLRFTAYTVLRGI